jgi:PII-like signaling protein
MSAALRALRLTSYFGERDRVGDRFLADALMDMYARHGLRGSVVLRGVQGFGGGRSRHTDRLLSLSEDLPLVAVAVDRRARILAALEEQRALARPPALVTLERVALIPEGPCRVVGAPGARDAWDADPAGAARLTVHLGRHERVGRRPAAAAAVALLHAHGVAGATVLLGVDGTAHGVRRRAAFCARNTAVPLLVVAVGDVARIGAVVPELCALLERPLMAVEPLTVAKRDGVRVGGGLTAAPDGDGAVRQKVMVFASEQARHQGRPLHRALVEELERAGAAGATSLRGTWGYAGERAPHGDTPWQLRRRVPVVVSVVDAPARMRRWCAVIDELTGAAGLVTSQLVEVPVPRCARPPAPVPVRA